MHRHLQGAGSGAGTLAWSTGNANVVARWVKGRLMAGIGPSVYELAGGAPPTLPTAKMTHLNSAWAWTDIAEGPSVIYASGYAGAQSSIYKFSLDNTGAVPTLAAGGAITAQLPLGETVNCMNVYLGTFVGIGTSRGFRVGEIDANGDISYGPLLIQVSGGVKSVAAYDRFFFVGGTNSIDGQSGLWRVDLGQIIQGRRRHGGPVRLRHRPSGARLRRGVVGDELRIERPHGLRGRRPGGLPGVGLHTGGQRVLHHRPGALQHPGAEAVQVRDGEDSGHGHRHGDGQHRRPRRGDHQHPVHVRRRSRHYGRAAPRPGSAVEWVQLRLDLLRSQSDSTKGAVVNGWQLKALPGAQRQRVIELPLLCMDKEKDQTGQSVGYDGRAALRLDAFEQLAIRGDAVSFQDLAAGSSTLVLIDDFKYEQKAAPSIGSNTGGIIYVQLRTIADVITS
jgi:hypothetical protein